MTNDTGMCKNSLMGLLGALERICMFVGQREHTCPTCGNNYDFELDYSEGKLVEVKLTWEKSGEITSETLKNAVITGGKDVVGKLKRPVGVVLKEFVESHDPEDITKNIRRA